MRLGRNRGELVVMGLTVVAVAATLVGGSTYVTLLVRRRGEKPSGSTEVVGRQPLKDEPVSHKPSLKEASEEVRGFSLKEAVWLLSRRC